MRKSTGKAKIVAYMVWGNSYKEQSGRINPARLKENNIDVFSNDFADVDLREKLCYPKPPEKANSKDNL